MYAFDHIAAYYLMLAKSNPDAYSYQAARAYRRAQGYAEVSGWFEHNID